MKVRKWVIPVLMAAAALLASCPGDILKNLDNPMDPKAPSYQGYHTVEGADEVEAHTPTDGELIVFLVFSVNEVFDAQSYRLQIATAFDFAETSLVYDKDDFPDRVLNAEASLIVGTLYYWRAAAKKDGVWGKWTEVREFMLGGGISTMNPANGASTTDTTPTFSWNAVSYAAGYELQLGDSLAGVESSPIQSIEDTSYTPVSALTNGQTHYWRVRAVDWDGQKGAWSAVHSLLVNWDWGTISGQSPADGSATTDTTPTFSWNAVPGAAGYELQLGDSRAGVESSPIQSVMGASYTPVSALTNEQTHYWRVRAVDWGGQKGVWSAVYSLAVSIGAVSGLSPANGASTTDTTPTLSWDAVPGAAGYELQLGDSLAGLGNASSISVTGSSYTPTSALTNEQTHYWQVRAKDGAGQFGDWSDAHSLRVEWGAVSGLSPADGASTTDTTPTFSWNAVPGATGYELQLGDRLAGLESSPIQSVMGASYTPVSALTNEQTHYWRVRAVDWDGQKGAWSAVHSLTVSIGTVSGLSPANGSSTTDTTPTLSWTAVPGAASYELRIADSESGLTSASSDIVTDTTHTPASALNIGQTYYWQVRAKDGDDQNGAWSAVQSLNVTAAPQGFVHVAGGTFQMGSTDSEAYSDESPVHSVTVDSFYMAETEVTFDQYDAYCTATGISKPDDRGWGRGSRPAIYVSWYDAVKYCNWLSEQEGLSKVYNISGTSVTWNQSANGYRLPTEAEWEYAARGGAQSNGYKYSGSNNLDEVGWYWDNSGSKTHPVKGKKANELGLYDMSGNVWEWCWDWYGSTYYSSSPGANPTGPSSGSNRVRRGGSWDGSARSLRVANRYSYSPGWQPRFGLSPRFEDQLVFGFLPFYLLQKKSTRQHEVRKKPRRGKKAPTAQRMSPCRRQMWGIAGRGPADFRAGRVKRMVSA